MNINFQAPIQTISEANQREHWAVKHRRKLQQQEAMAVAMLQNVSRRQIRFPVLIRLTRVGPKKLDSDNLAGSLKHCQDQIARQLGIDDGDDSKVKWEYSQMPVRIKHYAVKVEILTG